MRKRKLKKYVLPTIIMTFSFIVILTVAIITKDNIAAGKSVFAAIFIHNKEYRYIVQRFINNGGAYVLYHDFKSGIGL